MIVCNACGNHMHFEKNIFEWVCEGVTCPHGLNSGKARREIPELPEVEENERK
jgi:hypothetical protein